MYCMCYFSHAMLFAKTTDRMNLARGVPKNDLTGFQWLTWQASLNRAKAMFIISSAVTTVYRRDLTKVTHISPARLVCFE